MTDVDAGRPLPAGFPGPPSQAAPLTAERLTVRLFGRTAAWRNGKEVALGPTGQRTLFAVLALNASRPVLRRELLDWLWQDGQPREAVNIIHTYVKRLRRSLEPERPSRAPSGLLVRVNDGYALRIDANAVDLGRFRVSVDAARTARRHGDYDRVCLLLEEALRIWRSPLLADLADLAAHSSVRAIDDERATAVCWYAEAALRQGIADEALVTVGQAAAASPLDESLHVWLIRLYLALGRRAEGLAAYRRIKRRLARELGVDPHPELEQLHGALGRSRTSYRPDATLRSSRRPVPVHRRG